MRKGVFSVALLCLAAALLPACQPTPEEEIVVQQGEAADVPAGPVLAELLPLPERVDRPEQTLGGAAVTIAAQVIQPNAQACPVVEVRQTTFSRERLRELTERFCPGAELYHYWQPTQRELLEQRAALLEYGDGSEDAQIKLKWLDETIPTAPLTGAGSVRLERRAAGDLCHGLRGARAGGSRFLFPPWPAKVCLFQNAQSCRAS